MYKIGIFGSSTTEIEVNTIEKAKELGRALNKHKIIIITGACSGLPYFAAYQGSKSGNPVWGYSPKFDLNGQKEFTPKDDLSIYKKIIFVPRDFEFSKDEQVCKKYRNVISTANCDAGIIIAGRYGTLNEFTNLYDMGKVIGVLTGTGGIADELPTLSKKINKKSKAKVLFDATAKRLVQKVFDQLQACA